MKKLLLAFVLIFSTAVCMSQTIQYSTGNTKKAYGFNGGVYVSKFLYLGRFADTLTTSFTTTGITRPTRWGAIYYDSLNSRIALYRGTTLKYVYLTMELQATDTIDFGNQATATSADSTVTVVGAALGDPVSVSVLTAAVNVANTCFTAFVSATDTVTIRFNNYSAGSVNPASGVFKVKVHK
jgi:hypothetical protein